MDHDLDVSIYMVGKTGQLELKIAPIVSEISRFIARATEIENLVWKILVPSDQELILGGGVPHGSDTSICTRFAGQATKLH